MNSEINDKWKNIDPNEGIKNVLVETSISSKNTIIDIPAISMFCNISGFSNLEIKLKTASEIPGIMINIANNIFFKSNSKIKIRANKTKNINE